MKHHIAMVVKKIVIEKDGWVWVESKGGGAMGLGDIDVDVILEDNRK